ncbi:hypothetical protein LOTGIDRAFT_237555 [Lottia gigantea]|uniref:Nucleotide exchange factor SIL1 n=1 Tax=Lottia gigantea TaxID=225164 RepID=V4B7X2_LOTGI|nr:hypothetical protein LOTGIDRAFT_237555 [Lottia gigantea]ESP03726.1 hypothetical protein LOTGIDRAFT_237555 [Lottia gigantea]
MSVIIRSIKVVNITICLLFLIGCYVKLHVNSETPSDNPRTDLTVVDADDDEDGVVTVEESNGEIPYDKLNVFIPTKQWQTVQPGQAIPAGLHVRLNMKTGEREAKLNEGDTKPKYWKLGEKQGMVNSDKKTFTRDELKRALKDFKSEIIDDDSKQTSGNFKSYKELKEDFKKLNIGVKTDIEIINDLLEKLNQEKLDTESHKFILSDLEYYLHQIDNAVYFCDIRGMELLLKYLNSTQDEIRSETALVIGSALQSNPKAQISALETGLMQPLIRLISLDKSTALRKRYLYALSSLVRHFPYAQLKFVQYGGLSVFSKLFEESGTESLQIKVITLLNDLLQEKILTENDPQDNQNYREKLKQYQKVNVKDEMIKTGWCKLIPSLLELPDHDSREKIIIAMTTLQTSCWNEFVKYRPVLTRLSKEYERLSHEDVTDSYFTDLQKIIQNLLDNLNKKIEL